MFSEQDQRRRRDLFSYVMEDQIGPLLERIVRMCEGHGIGYVLMLSSPPIEADSRKEIPDSSHLHTVYVDTNGNRHSNLAMTLGAILTERWEDAFSGLAQLQHMTPDDLIDQLQIAAAVARVARRRLGDDATKEEIAAIMSEMIGDWATAADFDRGGGMTIVPMSAEDGMALLRHLAEGGEIPDDLAEMIGDVPVDMEGFPDLDISDLSLDDLEAGDE